MIKFDVLGTLILLYEVPYIAVPTLKDTDVLTDKEAKKVKAQESEITITVKQTDI